MQKVFTLLCFILCFSFVSLQASWAQEQKPGRISLLLDGKALDEKRQYAFDELKGALEVTLPGEEFSKVQVYLVRGSRPVKMHTVQGNAFKDFNLYEWLMTEGKAQDGTLMPFSVARAGDRMVVLLSLNTGEKAVNISFK
ncbi:hypothetical protein [Nibribacter koreensis]|uniref:Uncharacterized protein n=1 Tax=Nibribacter koreensis TaxID=1084519 RepID=A0ABP8FLY2_9BACT